MVSQKLHKTLTGTILKIPLLKLSSARVPRQVGFTSNNKAHTCRNFARFPARAWSHGYSSALYAGTSMIIGPLSQQTWEENRPVPVTIRLTSFRTQ